jgi:Domain of unknown function (DUF4157)
MRRISLCFCIGIIATDLANASWFSDFVGINIDFANPGKPITFGKPDLSRFGEMLRNLPKDTAQFFLNPKGNVLTFLIRRAKNDAKANCQPIPIDVSKFLSRLFPPDHLIGVCFAIYDLRRIELDSLLIGHLGVRGAVTLEDVIVFPNANNADSPDLWAHEMVHVNQYRRLGLETFAHLYMYAFAALEQEANAVQQVAERLLNDPKIDGNMWTGDPTVPTPIPVGQIIEMARGALPAGEYCASWTTRGVVGKPAEIVFQNQCSIPVKILTIRVRDNAGVDKEVPCVGSSCTIPDNGTVAMPSFSGRTAVKVTFGY